MPCVHILIVKNNHNSVKLVKIMRSVFEFESYKKFMSHRLYGEGLRGQLSRAAELLKCQPSFLSRVMSAEIHITPDQAFVLCEFWRLDEEEAHYFQSLVDWERASDPRYRSALKARIAKLRDQHESLQRRVQKPDFPVTQPQAAYFSTWCWSAIHFLVSIPKYQTVHAVAARLGLAEAVVEDHLHQLKQSGFVRQQGKRWEYAGGQFHLPKDSPFVIFHHQNWRGKAVLDAQAASNKNVHYTTVLTLSLEDLKRLKELTLGFISETDKIAKPSEPEECVVLTCDLFPP
jgi:uncharacterized protein (TIGR02147 family)